MIQNSKIGDRLAYSYFERVQEIRKIDSSRQNGWLPGSSSSVGPWDFLYSSPCHRHAHQILCWSMKRQLSEGALESEFSAWTKIFALNKQKQILWVNSFVLAANRKTSFTNQHDILLDLHIITKQEKMSHGPMPEIERDFSYFGVNSSGKLKDLWATLGLIWKRVKRKQVSFFFPPRCLHSWIILTSLLILFCWSFYSFLITFRQFAIVTFLCGRKGPHYSS